MADEKLEKFTPPEEVALVRHSYPKPNGYSNGYSYGYGVSDDSTDLLSLWRMVRRRKWLVMVITLMATTLVTVEMYRTRSTYQATTTIELGKENSLLVKTGDVVIQSDESDMKTKLLVLKSRPLLEDVAVNLRLDQNPSFLDVNGRRSFKEALRDIGSRVIGQDQDDPAPTSTDQGAGKPEGQASRPLSESARLAPYVSLVKKNLDVDQVKETRALVVSFTHTDPVIAAAVANGIAQSFIENSFQKKTERFTNTSAWLDRSTRELKAKAEQAERALADYTRQHNIFSTENAGNLTTEKLTRLHDQVMRAETDRLLKQSLYEEVQQGRVAQLPDAFADPKNTELQKKLGELATTSAQLSVKFGQKNPRVVEVQQQMTSIEEQIRTGRQNLEEKLKADYERAVRDEGALKAALNRAKAEAVQQNQSSIQYGILEQEVNTAKQLYNDFLQKTSQANIQVAEQYNNMRVIEPADVPASPVGPKRVRTIIISFFVSLMAGVALAFFLEYLDNTVKNIEDVSRYTQLPTLAVIPAITAVSSRSLLARRNSFREAIGEQGLPAQGEGKPGQLAPLDERAMEDRSLAAEAYRALRTSVLLSAAGGPPKTILFTSSQPGEGKTTTTINTAISLAQLGAAVLIIDADLRRPTIHKVFGVNPERGLATYLSREIEIDELIQKLEVPNLSLLSCGPIPPNPAELISSEKMRQMMRALTERYDHILIDSPPLMHVTDPVILSTLVDGVIMVVHSGKSTRDVVRRARQELSNVGAKVFGVVLNKLDVRRDGYDEYTYYSSYSSYVQPRSKAGGH